MPSRLRLRLRASLPEKQARRRCARWRDLSQCCVVQASLAHPFWMSLASGGPLHMSNPLQRIWALGS